MTTLVRAPFAALARLRDARAVHASGRTFTATVRRAGSCPAWLPVEDGTAPVRLSRGAGLPPPWPDVLGVAVRLPGGWDVLLSSSLRGLLPWPGRTWRGARFGTVMPYRCGAHLFRLALDFTGPALGHGDPARAAGQLPITATLALRGGPAVAHLALENPADDTSFDPTLNHPGDTYLVPRWLTRLRRAAYDGSRTGGDDRAVRIIRLDDAATGEGG